MSQRQHLQPWTPQNFHASMQMDPLARTIALSRPIVSSTCRTRSSAGCWISLGLRSRGSHATVHLRDTKLAYAQMKWFGEREGKIGRRGGTNHISVPAAGLRNCPGWHKGCTCPVRRTSEQAARSLGPVVHRPSCEQDTCLVHLVRTVGREEPSHRAALGHSPEAP